jgi:hypothetical protein
MRQRTLAPEFIDRSTLDLRVRCSSLGRLPGTRVGRLYSSANRRGDAVWAVLSCRAGLPYHAGHNASCFRSAGAPARGRARRRDVWEKSAGRDLLGRNMNQLRRSVRRYLGVLG